MPTITNKSLHKPEAPWRTFLNKVDAKFKVIIVVSFIFLAIIGFTSRTVPNLHYQNMTDPLARPIPYEGGDIPDGFTQILKYEVNDEVPNDFTPMWILVSYFLFLIIYMIIDTNNVEEQEFISANQAKYVLQRDWNYLKANKLVLGDLYIYEPTPQHTLKYIEKGEKRVASEWIFPAVHILPSGEQQYKVCGVNPYSQKITTFLNTEKEFSRADTCPECGKYSNIKYIDTEDYKRAREVAFAKPIQK